MMFATRALALACLATCLASAQRGDGGGSGGGGNSSDGGSNSSDGGRGRGGRGGHSGDRRGGLSGGSDDSGGDEGGDDPRNSMDFTKWRTGHGKRYTSDAEQTYRGAVFAAVVARVS